MHPLQLHITHSWTQVSAYSLAALLLPSAVRLEAIDIFRNEAAPRLIQQVLAIKCPPGANPTCVFLVDYSSTVVHDDGFPR